MPIRTFTGPSGESYTEVTGSVFEALTDDPAEIARYEARAVLLDRLIDTFQARGWKQQQIADVLGVKQPRVSALMNGRISEFSLDALVEYAYRAGLRVTLDAEVASPAESSRVESLRITALTPAEPAGSRGLEAWAGTPSLRTRPAGVYEQEAGEHAVNDYSYQLAS